MRKPEFIGVAGGSASGKSKLACSVQARAPEGAVSIACLDWYYRSRSDLTLEQRAQINYDHPGACEIGLLEGHLSMLRQGASVDAPVYDFASHSRQRQTLRIQPAPLILVEGTLALHFPELRRFYTSMVFVDLPPGVRFARRLSRDQAERGRTEESVRGQWRETVHPMYIQYCEPTRQLADQVVRTEEEMEEVIRRLVEGLRGPPTREGKDSVMPTLTSQQQAALDAVGKTTTVSAGAGTGKTSTMVERYLHIIRLSRDKVLPEELRAGVDGILTITFTDAAASELKQRLVQGLMALGMEEERRQVETAYISTIHGFCSRLLQENPFEAGLDPQFTVLTRAENALLQERAFEQVVDEGFLESCPEMLEVFQTFGTARRFGDSGDLAGLLRKETMLACDLFRSHGWRPRDLKARLDQGADGALAANVEGLGGHLAAIVGEVGAQMAAMEGLSVGVECAIEEARANMLSLRGRLNPPVHSLSEFKLTLDLLGEIRRLAGKTTGKKGADSSVLADLQSRFRSLARFLDTEKSLIADFDPAFEEGSSRLAHCLLHLVFRFWEKHNKLKQDAGKLDFNDLQSRARDLLEEAPAVQMRCQSRLRHVMVDEFQDTDSLQNQIVELLSSPGNLFCVGDAKQSIYGFRNADVSLFANLIESTCGDPSGMSCHLPLVENFRCRPEIIGFVNHVFSQIGVGAGISYEPLQSRADFGPGKVPCVEVLLAPGPKGGEPEGDGKAVGDGAAARSEAELVARRVRQMLDDDSIRITRRGEREGQPLQQGDFLLLLRTFTPLGYFERALAAQEIDCYVVGGRGYYAQKEIRDVANLLKTIRNPLDDLALAATLRSPFCGLSDEALYLLVRMGRGAETSALYDGVVKAIYDGAVEIPLSSDGATSEAGLPSEDRDRLLPFWKWIESIRRREDRTPIVSILEEILGETLYEARLLMQPQGRRKMANVRKLVVAASQRNAYGVTEFMEWLEGMDRVEEREGEAPTEEEAANVVRIRTIHGAKGLEGNVVFVTGLARSAVSAPIQRSSFLFDVSTGAGACHYPASESLKSRQSAAYSALLRSKDAKEMDEARRLLYVAMTRAREYLVLSGSFPCKEKSWGRQVLPCLGVEGPADEERRIDVDGVPVMVRSRIAGHRRQPAVARLLLQRIQAQMRAGQPIEPGDLKTLQSIG